MGLDIQILYEPKPTPEQKGAWLHSGGGQKGYLRESYGCGSMVNQIHTFVFGYDFDSPLYKEQLQGNEGDKAVHVSIFELCQRLKQVIVDIFEESEGDFDSYNTEALVRIKDCVEFVQCANEDAIRNGREYVRIIRWG